MQHSARHLSVLQPKCALLGLQRHLCIRQGLCAAPARSQQCAQRRIAARHLGIASACVSM